MAACWSKNRTIVRNFTWIAAASGDLCGRNAAVYLATGPEYRTIVTSYGYLDAVTGVFLEDLVKN